jgi:inorganic pyrophosphatase
MASMLLSTQVVKALTAWNSESELVNIIVEAPHGSRNKFKFDEKLGVFKLDKILPRGFSFPFDFGFIPSTKGADGDPLDVLVMIDEPTFVGCLITAKVIGIIEAKQTENRKTIRNDRLICSSATKANPAHLASLNQLPPGEIEEIGYFFSSYNEMEGRKFTVIGNRGPKEALRVLRKGIREHKRSASRNGE